MYKNDTVRFGKDEANQSSHLGNMKFKNLLLEGAASKHGLLAAIVLPSGEIFTGDTHFHAVENLNAKYPNYNFTVDDLDSYDGGQEIEDGFFDTKTEKFLTRVEAYKQIFGGNKNKSLHSGDAAPRNK